jgi:hypothetical protein
MGWETIAIAGFQAVQGIQGQRQAKKEGRAITQQAERETMNIADNTVRQAGSLRNSFLSSGLTLEGGPMDVISQAFAKGRTDVQRTAENANTASKNKVSAARTKMLSNLGSTAMGAAGGFASDFGDGFSTGFDNSATFQTGATPGPGLNNFGSGFNSASNTTLPWLGA